MRDLEISRLSSDRPTVVGRIDREHGLFIYDEGYLAAANTIPLSNSLPLRPEPFNEGEFRPCTLKACLPRVYRVRPL